MPVRSKLLASGATTNAFVTVYTVPSGKTCLVKAISAFLPTGAANETLEIRATPAGTARMFDRVTLTAGQSMNSSYGLVLPPGATITIRSTPNGLMSFMLCGAELEGVAP